MKIVISSAEDASDGRCGLRIDVDGIRALSFMDGEPEDNTINRGFNDVLSIGDLISKVATEAAKGGEIIIESSHGMDWEDYIEL